MLFRKKIRKQFAITIPDPCSEVWSEMKVVDSCHRHCAACDRVLTDFSQMNDDELMLFFKQSNGKICGRFRKDQVNRPMAMLPETTRPSSWWKAAMLLPLTLFAKSTSAQQNDSLAVGDSLIVQNDSVVHPTDTMAVDSALAQTDFTPAAHDSLLVEVPVSVSLTWNNFPADRHEWVLGWCPIPTRASLPENPVARVADTFSVDTTQKTVQAKPVQSVYAPTSTAYSENPPPEPKEAPAPPPIPARPWYDAILPERFRIRRT